MKLRNPSARRAGAFALCVAGGMAALGPGPARAENAAPAPTGEATVEEVVVTSYARSLAEASELKRTSAYGLDAISAEDIGKFPTRNAAEALQLVTGVTIERPRGAGLYVSVRGLGPQFQNVQLNGRSIAVNDLIENGGARGRQFRFEVLPSELISQIEVVKTPTADMDDGALGGNINIKTFRPLDLGKRAAFSLRGAWNDVVDETSPSGSALLSWTNHDETLGVLVSGLYDHQNVRNDRLYQSGWNLNRFSSVLGAGLYTPTRTRPTIETEDREMGSASVAVQWRPTPELQTDFDVLATRLDVDYDEFGLDIYPDDTTFRTPVFRPGTAKIVGDTVQAGTIDNVRWMASREISLNRHDLVALGLKQTWTPGEWKISGELAYSRARSYHPEGRATTRNRLAFFAPLTFDFSRGYQAVPQLTTNVDYNNAANYVGQAFDYTWKDSRDLDEMARLDIGHSFTGPITQVTAGVERHHRNREYLRRDWVLNDILNTPATSLGPDFYGPLPYGDFLSDWSGNTPRTWLAPSSTAFYQRLFTPAVAAQPWSAADLRNSFEVDEKIWGAYVRGDFELEVVGVPVSGNLGVRYAKTEQVASGTLTSGSTPVSVSYPKDYDNWLPSFNLRAEFSPALIGRLAASRVVNRPNVTDVAPRITVSRDTPTAGGGNPDLDPFLATQYDASLEWYPTRTTALTGAVFFKKMDDYITAQNTTIQVPGRGDILLSTNVNGGEAKLSGIELAYNQVFDFLPGPFDGFGVQASVTRVKSEANYFAGNRQISDDLIGLSKSSYNLVGYYEKGPLAARIGWFWRSKYLNGIGNSTTAPNYVDDFGSLDGSVSWQIDSHFSVVVEGSNLSDEARYIYGKSKDQPMEIYHWGRTVSAALRGKF